MRDATLRGSKMDAYVLLKILKYCTDSPARSYQLKFAIEGALKNKNLKSIKFIGDAMKEIIHYKTIRGKFSSVHPDLAAEGITKVEVGDEGFCFVADKSGLPAKLEKKTFTCLVSDVGDQGLVFDTTGSEDEDEMLKRAIATSLEV